MERILMITIAIVLDWLLGDPYWMPHPIRGIGWLIRRVENLVIGLRVKKRVQGILLWVIVITIVFTVGGLILWLLEIVHPLLNRIGQVILIYTCLAARCLDLETRKVQKALEKGQLSDARELLSFLVGRETKELSQEEVIRAGVETVAENTVDGVIAPLFYAFIGGAPLALAYKAINTLDSMVGYKNEKYLHLGWASAKMDDWVNLLPARLTACLIPVAALFYNGNLRYSYKIMFRDRFNHSSPNAGHPEAAIAGALKVQLGGTNRYFGQVVEKPRIGDSIKRLTAEKIGETIYLMYITEVLAFIGFAGLSYLFHIYL